MAVCAGYTLQSLLVRGCESVRLVLEAVGLLVDGAFDRNLTKNAGEYRGASNQRLILYPILRYENEKRTD